MGLVDGLPSLEVKATTFSGTTAQFGAQEIGATELKVVGTGSPVTYGLSILTGSSATGAGSTVWVVFGKPFASNPYVTVGVHSSTNLNVTEAVGSRNPGSAFFISHGGGNVEFSWIAIGSGQI